MIDEEATYREFGYFSYELKQKSQKKIIALCDNCGKKRTVHKAGYHTLCLSCAHKGCKSGANSCNWKGGKIKGVCEECGAIFYRHKSDMEAAKKSYCSRECYGLALSKNKREANHPNWKGGKILSICPICGNSFFLVPSRKKSGRGKCCSQVCRSKYHSMTYRGVKHHSWKGGISFEPYCRKFNKSFKVYIRTKFDNICFLCGKAQEMNVVALSVHHINGNKRCGCDNDPSCQFVPLCRSCHTKIHNNPELNDKLKNKLKSTINGWFI